MVPLEIYLTTSYRPDCDWLDGELKERSLGERPHATIQGFLAYVVPETPILVSVAEMFAELDELEAQS